jgi:ribosomal protein L11 methyltransferase
MTSASQSKIWFSVEIETAREAVEAVEFALLESGALGTDVDMFGANMNAEILTVTGYFDAQTELQPRLPKLDEALEIYGFPREAIKTISWKEIEQRDWLEEWKKNWQPVESGRFIVAPTWSEIPDSSDKIIIRIEPGMAFGTGTHETTRLCLEAIDKIYKSGSFLDVGTGTAVLAIAAAKMFPEAEIEACDNDADAVAIARENAELNDAGTIEFYEGSITDGSPEFDFICANLTADVIIPLLPLLVGKTREVLVLSGILAEQRESVVNKLKELGQDEFTIDHMSEWISLTLSKK